MRTRFVSILFFAVSICGLLALGLAQTKHESSMGYTDTPLLPDGKWRVHDLNRPQPVKIAGATCSTQTTVGVPPSDAEVLFNGKDLSKWKTEKGDAAPWAVRDGYMEVVPHSGDIYTREDFGPIQLHVEWRTPAPLLHEHVYQGNSGVFLMGVYELQVFESSVNLIYADGQAGAMYGQYPPLVNPARDAGQWQVFDVVFIPGHFKDGKVETPPYITAFENGVLIQNHTAIWGDSGHRKLPAPVDHGPKGPIRLQDHSDLVRFRNIWVRRL